MNLARFREVAFDECRLDPNLPVVAGVSGGPDSLSLLDLFVQAGFYVIAAHFDHRLRPESERDAASVRQATERMNVPFSLGSLDVAAYAADTHQSLEQAAREARYHFLFEQANRYQAQAVAVGHTADDQVETVLMHLLRGAGWNGLTGMAFRSFLPAWSVEIPLVRPLLFAWREETLFFCRERGLEPVFDGSNQDITFTRNRIRHELVPLLETFNPHARQNIWRSAYLLAGDGAILQAAVQSAWEDCRAEVIDGAVFMQRTALCALDSGLQRGVLRRSIAQLDPGLLDLDFASVERGLRFAQSGVNGQVDLVNGLYLTAEGERIWITSGPDLPYSPDWPRMQALEIAVEVPGMLDVAVGWRLSAEWGETDDPNCFQGTDPWEAWLDADSLPGPLRLRRPHPGDRFQPLGMDGRSTQLSDFWINQKLPRRARAAWPLVLSSEEIVWVPGFRLAHPVRIQESTRRVLHLRLFRED